MDIRGRYNRMRRQRRGAALVEFALVAPLFLLFMVGLLEIGRAIIVQQLVTNAAREGARVAAYATTTQTSTVTNSVNSYLTSAQVSGATTTMSPSPPSLAAVGEPVSVTVTIPYTQVNWGVAPIFLGGQTLQSTSVMRREAAP